MSKLGVGRKSRRSKSAHHLIKEVDPDKLIDIAVKRATCQPGVSKQPGMTESADKFLSDRTGMLQEEFFQRVGEKLEIICSLLMDDLIDKHHLIPPQNLAYTYNTMFDKALALAGRPQALTAQLNVGLGATGLSREEVVAALTGVRDEEEKVLVEVVEEDEGK